ncbi:AbrB/MazE/SpoVT family DNA-binding domain-containing protein [Okeanomitos corallinicola TIOX110]|uniref:AbrB/MazE/SpoVT family DNA-binding domain-containing protein n=1 Tax=Okeanomitos corallinicola TIOX110 TaxID=3133117 RepID=A0ABZ2UV90_9CYAN
MLKIVFLGCLEGRRSLKKSCITSEVEIEFQGNNEIISPVEPVRKGWEKAFIEMAENGDYILLDDV